MENGLRKRVAAIATSAAMLGSVAAYNAEAVMADEIDVNDVSSVENSQGSEKASKETVNDDSVKFEGVYDTEKDAQDKAKEKEKEYNDKGYTDITSDITKIENERETGKVIERQVESDVTVTENAYIDLTKEEALKKKQELEVDNHDKKVTVVIRAYQKDSGKDDVININKTFNSEEEANAYIESLRSQGYEITEDKITANTKEEAKSFTAIFNTLEEANEALNEFKNSYDNVKGDVSKERNTNKDTKEVTKGTIKYDSIEEAIKAKDALEEETDSYIITATVREETKSNVVSEKVKSEKFDTQEEALAYIENLKKQGYDVSDLEVKLLSVEESIWRDESGAIVDPGQSDGKEFKYSHFDVTLITNFTKIDSEGNETNVKGNIKVGSVTISGKDVKMQGPSKDPNSGLTEYTSTSRNGLNVTNKSLVKITGTVTVNGQELPFVVEGYLSEAQNVCKGRGNSKGYDLEFKKVTIVNNKVLVDTNIINTFQVEGTISKTKDVSSYYVDSEKTTKGYDYKAWGTGTETVKDGTYNLSGIASRDIIDTKYALDVTTENKNYEYEKEIVKETLYGLLVTANIPVNEKEDPVIDNNDKDNTNKPVSSKETVKEDTPKTSDDSNLGLYAGAAALSLAGAGVVLTRKRKRD